MTRLSDYQSACNAGSRPHWDAFATHRARTTEQLRGTGNGTSRLCVLGAGNINDLDLGLLLASHREVHLVDLDADALNTGVYQQGFAGHEKLHLHGGIDVTGVFAEMDRWTPHTPISDAELRACADRPSTQVAETLGGPFDLVASTCLLTQIINGIVRTAGESHPQFVAALQALRAGHLRLLTALLSPGATGVLITDVVSSDTLPDLAGLPQEKLPQTLQSLTQTRNFFHGVNPSLILAALHADPAMSDRITDIQPVRPWLWDFLVRTYLVWAVTFRKQ